jgi:hypothetical protein
MERSTRPAFLPAVESIPSGAACHLLAIDRPLSYRIFMKAGAGECSTMPGPDMDPTGDCRRKAK